MEYNDHDLLAHWDENYTITKTRKEEFIDPRNYIIGILHYKFGYTEHELSEIFKLDHSSINYAKRMPYTHLEVGNKKFIEHVNGLLKTFPYTFPEPGTTVEDKLFPVTLMFDKTVIKSLLKYSKACGKRKNRVCAEIIINEMKKWDV